jgi:hypothetical protein
MRRHSGSDASNDATPVAADDDLVIPYRADAAFLMSAAVGRASPTSP